MVTARLLPCQMTKPSNVCPCSDLVGAVGIGLHYGGCKLLDSSHETDVSCDKGLVGEGGGEYMNTGIRFGKRHLSGVGSLV